jgi:hypothetical protein
MWMEGSPWGLASLTGFLAREYAYESSGYQLCDIQSKLPHLLELYADNNSLVSGDFVVRVHCRRGWERVIGPETGCLFNFELRIPVCGLINRDKWVPVVDGAFKAAFEDAARRFDDDRSWQDWSDQEAW